MLLEIWLFIQSNSEVLWAFFFSKTHLMIIMEIKAVLSLAEFRILNKTHPDLGQLKSELCIFGLSYLESYSFRKILFDLLKRSVDVTGYVL